MALRLRTLSQACCNCTCAAVAVPRRPPSLSIINERFASSHRSCSTTGISTRMLVTSCAGQPTDCGGTKTAMPEVVVEPAPTAAPRPEFYKRDLPTACVAFQSAEGKRLFAEALADGTMECYFPLAAQFRTRKYTVYTLRACKVDPSATMRDILLATSAAMKGIFGVARPHCRGRPCLLRTFNAGYES